MGSRKSPPPARCAASRRASGCPPRGSRAAAPRHRQGGSPAAQRITRKIDQQRHAMTPRMRKHARSGRGVSMVGLGRGVSRSWSTMASFSFSAPKCELLMARQLASDPQASVPRRIHVQAPVYGAHQGVQIIRAGDRRTAPPPAARGWPCVIPAARDSRPPGGPRRRPRRCSSRTLTAPSAAISAASRSAKPCADTVATKRTGPHQCCVSRLRSRPRDHM